MKMRGLLMLLWIPTLAFAQGSYYGTTVSSIRLSEEADTADVALLKIRVGDVIRPEQVRTAIQALFDTGRYRSVDVDATSSGNGTALIFKVTPHYFFSTFRLEPENLLGRPLSTLLRLPVGQKFSQSLVDDIAEETKKLLKEAGYFNVTITASLGPDNDEHLRTVELHATTDADKPARISDVSLQGGDGVFSMDELRGAFHVSKGDVYNAAEIDKGRTAIQRKYLDRNFLNTQVETTSDYNTSANAVRLQVTINSGQKTVIDTGGQIPDDEVRNLVPVFEEGSFDPDLLREGRARIVEYLQQKGYFDAVVEGPKIIPSNEGSPVRMTFSINRGQRHTVRSVKFRGNTKFSEEDLKQRIKVQAAGFLGHGILSDELLKEDIATIQSMYRYAGFEAAFVEAHTDQSPRNEIDVVFDIIENAQYRIDRIDFTGNDGIAESELRSAITLKEGALYSPAEAEEARSALARLYHKKGYPYVGIDATADRNPETNGRVLTYRIAEGQKYRIGKILIAGNTRTASKFIRRTSGLSEFTSPLNPEAILEAQTQLYGTGLFRRVDIVPLERDTNEIRMLLIQVEETKPILITPGIGVKEYTGPRVTLDVSHNNLFGGNRTLGLRFRWGVHEQQFQTTYHEPRLFNHDRLEGSGILTVEKRNQPSFETTGFELALQVRKRLSTMDSLLATARHQTVNFRDIKLNPVVRRFPDLEGIIQIARLGVSYVHDSRDDAIDPKQGVFSTSTFEVANRKLHSEVNFLALFHQSTYQRKAGIATLAASSRVGWKVPYGSTAELPITERYFAGGSTSLRGFGLDEAGPPGGGQLLTVSNLEYRVPVKSFSFGVLGGALFYDTGNVFERPADFALTKFEHSAGFGLRFLTPLGPVRFDTGFNLNPKTRIDEDGSRVREGRIHFFFTLGHAF